MSSSVSTDVPGVSVSPGQSIVVPMAGCVGDRVAVTGGSYRCGESLYQSSNKYGRAW